MSRTVYDRLSKRLPLVQGVVHDINAGGCGEFALELSRALRAKGEKCSVVISGDISFKSDVQEMLRNCQTKDINTAWLKILNGEVPNQSLRNVHLAVMYEGLPWGCRGELGCCYDVLSRPIKDSVLEMAVGRGEFWNSDYRSSNIGIDTRKMLNRFFTYILNTNNP
jgi:hypothetical protein